MTLLFCDVVRSTELTRRLGDRGAYRAIGAFHELVVHAAADRGGKELELRGDGMLLAFAEPLHAVEAALEIQRRVLALPADRSISVRIGVHHGPALRVPYGYFGGTVIMSARIAEEAGPGEILASSALLRRIAGCKHTVGAGRWVSLKGIPEPNLVFSLLWRAPEAAPAEPPCPSPAHEALVVTLDRMRESSTSAEESSCILNRRSAV